MVSLCEGSNAITSAGGSAETMLWEKRELQNPQRGDSGVAYVHADASMPNVYLVLGYYIAIIRVCGVRKDAIVAMK
jgi:hypothetical protein